MPEGRLEEVGGLATGVEESIAEVGVPEFLEFLEQIVDSGGHLWAGRMSADMNHLTMNDLYGGVEASISAADFIEKTGGA
jgi:predicted peroxiredoxin